MVPEEAPPITTADALGMISAAYKADRALMRVGDYIPDEEIELEEGGNLILVRSMRAEDQARHLLLHHGDANAADPALMEFKSGDVRKAGKLPGEGVAHASHLAISLLEDSKKQVRAALERVPNLGRGTVTAFLNRILREEAKRQKMSFKDKETKKDKRCHPKLRAQQQMSHQLRNDLEKGKLSRVEFVSRDVVGGFEEPDQVIPVVKSIVHKIVSAPTGHAAFDLIQRMKDFARKHNYEEMQIRFRRTDSDQNLSPRFSTEVSDAMDTIYSRFELVRFEKALEQCPKEIVPAMVRELTRLLEDSKLWK